MDSGHEAVLVDVNLATTNGINGTHDEIAEMKTRSKGAGGDAATAAEAKTRPSRATTAQSEKDASDPTEKSKKRNARGDGADEAVAGAKAAKEAAAVNGAKATASVAAASSKAPTAPTAPAKKKAPERDDDSGINSRASSVSADEVATPARMRTRSSRASDYASTSTPAPGRGGAARVPLSIYEYEAGSFDDDLPLAATFAAKGVGAARKRKAVVYVEEMEEEEEVEAPPKESGAEPAPKRRAAFLVSAGAGVVASLLYPWRKLRTGIAAIRPFKAAPSDAAEVASAEQDGRAKGADGAVAADQSTDAGAPTNSQPAAHTGDQPASDEAADTCSLM